MQRASERRATANTQRAAALAEAQARVQAAQERLDALATHPVVREVPTAYR